MRKFKPDLIIVTYFLLNSQTTMFRSFTRLNGKSYLGQHNYLVETTRFPAQKLESQLETGHVFTQSQYCPLGTPGVRRSCSATLSAVLLLSR